MNFLLILSIIPSIVIAYLIYSSDKKEKEPIKELIKAFLLGVASIIITLVVSFVLGISKIDIDSSKLIDVFFYSFVCIALIEEFSKWICSHLFVRKNPNFDYLFDGIVYFTFVSLGFATLENIIYCIQMGLSAVIIRAITTVPAHAFFGVTSGYFYALARREKFKFNLTKAKGYFVLSIVLPIILHGFYDFCLLTQNVISFMIYIIFVVSLYVFSIANIKKMMRIDHTLNSTDIHCRNCGEIVEDDICKNCGNKV